MTTPKEALELPFYCGDLDQTLTIREYMRELLSTLFEEGEGFSGKRPFGNSGWEYDLHLPLVKSGAVAGSIEVYAEGTEDEDIEVTLTNQSEFDAFVQMMIAEL